MECTRENVIDYLIYVISLLVKSMTMHIDSKRHSTSESDKIVSDKIDDLCRIHNIQEFAPDLKNYLLRGELSKKLELGLKDKASYVGDGLNEIVNRYTDAILQTLCRLS